MGKKDKKETIYVTLAFAVLLVIVYITITPSGEDGKNRRECPYEVQGSDNPSFLIKYIDSPYCIWCWFEEPILKKLVAEKPDTVRIEKYDIRHCGEEIGRYGFSGTPSFVFGVEGGAKEFTHSGFISKEDMWGAVCSATGDCTMEGKA